MKLPSWILRLSKRFPENLREHYEALPENLRAHYEDLPQNLKAHYEELPPHGQILVLSVPERELKLNSGAIASILNKFVDQPTPFVAILIDLGGIRYILSSADLGSIASTMAAWVRGWVAPCAIVMSGDSARELQRMLEITKLDRLEQLRVLETQELGLIHIRTQLDRARTKDLR